MTDELAPRLPSHILSALEGISPAQVRRDGLDIDDTHGLAQYTSESQAIISGESGFSNFQIEGSGKPEQVRFHTFAAIVPMQTRADIEGGRAGTYYLSWYASDSTPAERVPWKKLRKKLLSLGEIKKNQMKRRWPHARFDENDTPRKDDYLGNIDHIIALVGIGVETLTNKPLMVFWCPAGKSPEWVRRVFKNNLLEITVT